MNYEEIVAESEEILAKLESGDLGLEESLKLFEKSVELSKKCFDKLQEAEGKVEIIRKQLDKITIKPFDEIEDKD